VEQSYRFGFHRLGSVLLVSVLVGLAIIGGLILFIIPGIYIAVRLAVCIEALVVEGRRGTQAMGRSSDTRLMGRCWTRGPRIHAGAGVVMAAVRHRMATLATPEHMDLARVAMPQGRGRRVGTAARSHPRAGW
jgi:hypothetical protein